MGPEPLEDMKFPKIKESEIKDIIKNDLQNNKSPGYDNVHSVLIKWSSHIISPILEKLFNKLSKLDTTQTPLKLPKLQLSIKGDIHRLLKITDQYRYFHTSTKYLKN